MHFGSATVNDMQQILYYDNNNFFFFKFFRLCRRKNEKKINEKVAVKSVSFTIAKGQVFGLLGNKENIQILKSTS